MAIDTTNEKVCRIQGETIRDEDGSRVDLPPTYIPWWLAEEAYKGYHCDQSLEKIDERGGFGRQELLDLLRRKDDR